MTIADKFATEYRRASQAEQTGNLNWITAVWNRIEKAATKRERLDRTTTFTFADNSQLEYNPKGFNQ